MGVDGIPTPRVAEEGGGQILTLNSAASVTLSLSLPPSSLCNGCIVPATQAPQNPTPPSGILPWILERPLQIPDISPLYGTIGGSPPPPGGALGRRSLLCLGRSDAPVNDMLGIAQQHRGGWRSVLLPSCHLGPGPRARKWGEWRDTASRGTLGVCSASFQEPGFHYPHPTPNSARRPKGSVEKAAEGW